MAPVTPITIGCMHVYWDAGEQVLQHVCQLPVMACGAVTLRFWVCVVSAAFDLNYVYDFVLYVYKYVGPASVQTTAFVIRELARRS